jgi:hypothetical protein
MSHILTTRRSRRFLLVFIILSVGSVIMLILNNSQGSLDLGSYGGYFGLDSNWKPITAQNSRWRGPTVAGPIELPEATWTCTDDHLAEQDKETKSNRRSRQCIVENLCVDRKGIDPLCRVHSLRSQSVRPVCSRSRCPSPPLILFPLGWCVITRAQALSKKIVMFVVP